MGVFEHYRQLQPSKAVFTTTTSDGPRGGEQPRNVYLFPNMLDHYQIQLTRMLEAEQFGQAKRLIRFLLDCRGLDERHYDEWRSLLGWLETAFPGGEDDEAGEADSDPAREEERMRSKALGSRAGEEQNEAYARQVLHVMKHHPLPEQQLLALERAVYLEGPDVDETILDWLSREDLHPSLQFRALQTLRRRGIAGRLMLERAGETVELEVERTPLSLDDFPPNVLEILDRVERMTESTDPTLPHFAREMWKECLQTMYGTSDYEQMTAAGEDMIDCWAAALHHTLLLAAYGRADDEEVRDEYGIPESLRFRYEQACKAIRRAAAPLSGTPGQP